MADEAAAVLEGFSREDLLRVCARDRFVKGQQDQRISSLMRENIELLAIVQEQGADIQDLKDKLEQANIKLQGAMLPVTDAASNGQVGQQVIDGTVVQ